MVTVLDTPRIDDAEAARKSQLLRSVLRTMVALDLFGFTASLFDTRNDLRMSFLFYVPILLGIFGLGQAVRRGHVVFAAWSVSIFFWILIAIVTLVFGGMQGLNAANFGVCAVLVGSVVSGRAGVIVAVVSSAWCALVALLEINHALPTQLGSYSPINSWAALTVALVLMTVLMRNAIDSLRVARDEAVATAAERDAALRRSLQAQKMELAGNLASGVAHDFNNLLTVISSVSAGLRTDMGSDRIDERAMLDDLDDATARAALMTRQLLSLARSGPSELVDIDLNEQVCAFGPLLQRLVGSTITVEVRTAPGAVVRATQVGIEQILLNLAVNARDAMPNGGPLAIEVRVEDDDVRLLVTDGGIGMDAATRDRIFTPFFTTKPSGTGLGLATVRDRVAQFGGTITVDSEPGRGTAFAVRLARAAAPAYPKNGLNRQTLSPS